MAAANPIVIVEQGIVRIPDELHGDSRFRDGARVQLVPLAPLARRPAGEWRSLEGVLAHPDIHLNQMLDEERIQELDEANRREREASVGRGKAHRV